MSGLTYHICFDYIPVCVPAEPLHSTRSTAEDPHVHRTPAHTAVGSMRVRLLPQLLYEDDLPHTTHVPHAHQVRRTS